MARWRRVAGTWLALWETPGHLILPDKPLLDRGLVLLQRTAENQQETLTLVRLQDGATLWAVPIDGPIASSNVAGEVVLIALRDRVMGLAVPDGKLLWEQPLTFPIDTGWAVSPQFAQSQWFKDRSISGQGTGGGLLVIGDRFFLCVQGTIFGASAQTGDILWKRKLCFSLSFPLLGYGELVLAATSDKGFGALNAADGSVVWGHGLNRVQAVFTVGDEIYAAHKDEGLVRLEPASGQVLWQAAIDTEPKMKLTPVGNRLVVQCDQAVHILDREHGDRLWKGDHPGLKSALRDDVIYYQDGAKGPLVCKQVADLAERWRVKPKDPGVWSLHAAPETLIVMAPGTVEGFDLQTGGQHWWRTSGPGVLYDTATWTSNERGVFVHHANETRGFDLTSGRWVLRLPGRFFFVHWMHVQHDTLYLHSGAPGSQSLGAIPIGWMRR